ncbi:hypothetical protein D3C81_1965670 [compost metagenome]
MRRVSRFTALYDGLGATIQVNLSGFACLAFPDGQFVALHVLKGEAQQVTDPQCGVDTEAPDVRVQGVALGVSG